MDVRYIKDSKYYCWDLKRQKTGIDVKIRIKADDKFNQVLMLPMLMLNKGTWLLPVLDGLSPNDNVKIIKRVNNFTSNHIDKFRDWLKEVNSYIIKKNVETGDNIPLAPTDVSYYSYRHSFAQMYLAKGGSVIALASLIGHSIDTISVYVKSLGEDDDLAEAVDIID